MKKNILSVLVLVLVAGVAFYGGISYAATSGMNKNSATALSAVRGQFAGGPGMRGGANRNASGGFVNGDIIAKDANSVTVKLRDGGSKIVFLTANTPILKSVSAQLSELQVGATISVDGTPNTDGSLTAKSLQIRPAMTQ